MDNTETYIKMSDCPEIQSLRLEGHRREIFYGKPNDFTAWRNHHYIWLPRQDQLQEMVIGDDKAVELGEHFGGWILNAFDWGYREQFTSMEQLWLAFVMKEKYNKTWDGGKWC